MFFATHDQQAEHLGDVLLVAVVVMFVALVVVFVTLRRESRRKRKGQDASADRPPS